MRRGKPAGWAAVGLLMACAGCDSHAGAPAVSGSLEEATVKGTVRIHGKPVNNGSVVFNCVNIRRPNATMPQATINKDGTYEIKTLVGQNYVELSCRELTTPKNRVFADTQIPVMVQSGENKIDLELPPSQPTPGKAQTP
jgi:hypothetical protein